MPRFRPVEHKGRIVSIEDQMVCVEIVNTSACASCRAKTLCSMSDKKEKLLRLPLGAGQSWEIGEEVVVSLRGSLGLKAVFLVYIVPLLALLAVLFGLSFAGTPDWVTGLTALVVPLFCYFVVWIYRDKIEKEYIFVLNKPHSI